MKHFKNIIHILHSKFISGITSIKKNKIRNAILLKDILIVIFNSVVGALMLYIAFATGNILLSMFILILAFEINYIIDLLVVGSILRHISK